MRHDCLRYEFWQNVSSSICTEPYRKIYITFLFRLVLAHKVLTDSMTASRSFYGLRTVFFDRLSHWLVFGVRKFCPPKNVVLRFCSLLRFLSVPYLLWEYIPTTNIEYDTLTHLSLSSYAKQNVSRSHVCWTKMLLMLWNVGKSTWFAV